MELPIKITLNSSDVYSLLFKTIDIQLFYSYFALIKLITI